MIIILFEFILFIGFAINSEYLTGSYRSPAFCWFPAFPKILPQTPITSVAVSRGRIMLMWYTTKRSSALKGRHHYRFEDCKHPKELLESSKLSISTEKDTRHLQNSQSTPKTNDISAHYLLKGCLRQAEKIGRQIMWNMRPKWFWNIRTLYMWMVPQKMILRNDFWIPTSQKKHLPR